MFTAEFDVVRPEMKALDVGIDIGVVHAVATSSGRFYDLDTDKLKEIEKKMANGECQVSFRRFCS